MSTQAWQDELLLKTYLLGPEDPNPPWHRTGSGRIYPYPMQDDLTDHVEVLPYRALHIENDYLHAIILPDLGGRLYSLYDKVYGREVFYRNNVVKYGLVARRGAWISGGIEFNFPQGHTCVTVSPVQSHLHENEDGSASVTIGYTERVCRMRCSVTLTLVPNEARLRQDVMLHNPRPLRQRHYFWANSAVPARDDLHLVYPCNRARTLGGEWPYPIVNGRDMSWYRNHERPNDIFALDAQDDFFGCYYGGLDAGLVHWADHRLDFGKKFFTWGTADEGMIWVDLLTDEDGQYVEMQSGRFVDQSTFDFLFPYQTVGWCEYWYPLSGMGGFAWANDRAALDLRLGEGMAEVAALVNTGSGQGQLTLTVSGRLAWQELVDLAPGRGVRRTVPLPGVEREAPASLSLLMEGQEVVRYDSPPAYLTRLPLEIRARPLRPADDPDISATELCTHAVRHEMTTEYDEACRLYERAAEKAQRFPEAYLGLGLMKYQSGLVEMARVHFEEAVGQNPQSDEARYYLALVLAEMGEVQYADQLLWQLMGRTRCRAEAAVLLGRLALRSGNPDEALRALAQAPDGPTTVFLRAVAARLACPEESKAEIPTPLDDPCAVNLWAERYLSACGGCYNAAEAAFADLVRAADDDPQLWVELAFEYADLGLLGDALTLMEKGRAASDRVRRTPMTGYVTAWLRACLRGLVGNTPDGDGEAASGADSAAEDLAHAFACNPEYCFPSRVEEVEVLRWAAAQSPADWKARLYLGNLLAFLGRREEALTAWREAASIDDHDAVLCRNLALAHRLWLGNHTAALKWYAKAIQHRPDEYHLYIERDRALTARGTTPEERLACLAAAPEALGRRWEIAAIRVECLLQLERWDEAVEIMQTHKFRPWEGARAMHQCWVQALQGRAEARLRAGDPAGALADYELALTYPRNLGVGRSAYPQESALHWKAAEVAKALGDETARRAHLEAAAAEQHPHVCEADLYTLRALRALNRDAEADELAERLKSWAAETLAGHPDNPLARRVQEEVSAC